MKYKVFNNNPFMVGIRFEHEVNREIGIKPNSFVLMTEDDILYVDTVSTLFEEGVLFVDNQELMEKMGYIERNPNTITDEEVKRIFSLSNAKMKEALEKITAQHAIDKIVSLAKQSDLNQSKMKIIKDQFNIESLFEDLDQTVV